MIWEGCVLLKKKKNQNKADDSKETDISAIPGRQRAGKENVRGLRRGGRKEGWDELGEERLLIGEHFAVERAELLLGVGVGGVEVRWMRANGGRAQ